MIYRGLGLWDNQQTHWPQAASTLPVMVFVPLAFVTLLYQVLPVAANSTHRWISSITSAAPSFIKENLQNFTPWTSSLYLRHQKTTTKPPSQHREISLLCPSSEPHLTPTSLHDPPPTNFQELLFCALGYKFSFPETSFKEPTKS